MTAKILQCAIYTRKSSDEGLEQEFNSLDAQREACAAYIKSQAAEGWRALPDRFDDGGFTGGNMDRPALQKLMGEIKRRRIQVIVVYKIDRLTRSLADFARLVEVLDAHGASFVSVTQQFNTTTSMGRLTLNVLLSFAQFEREVTSERIRDKIGASKRRGMWMGGFPPLGYDIVNRRLAVNEKEAARAREIFELALATPSLTRLTRVVAEKGLTTKRWKTQKGAMFGGGPFARGSLHKMLRNPIYIGKIRQGGAHYEGEHEAVIPLELWNAVQERLDAARQGQTRSRKNVRSTAPLLGLLFDDVGNRMGAASSKNRGVLHRYYCSMPKLRGTTEPVGSISRVNGARIDDIVFAALVKAGVAPPGADRTALVEPVARVILHASEVEIRLKDDNGFARTLRAPIDLASPYSARKAIERDGADRQDASLIRAVALAYHWAKRLEEGAYASVVEIAEAYGMSERYVWKILRLAHLAPDIVEAILDGSHPMDLTLRRLNDTQIASDWGEQRAALGFAA